MSAISLVRHPAPHPTESLLGYVARLCEVNGYKSPRDIFRLAGMSEHENSATTFAIDKLALIAQQPLELIQRIAFTSNNGEQIQTRLLGQKVWPTYLNLRSSRTCLQCVSETGFIDASWHLELMHVCPKHENLAVWYCANRNPGHKVFWMRHDLLKCHCGAPLVNSFYTPSETDFWIQDLLRAKLHGKIDSLSVKVGMPIALFKSMDLQQTLSLMKFLGTRSYYSSRGKKPKSRQIMQAAGHVLSDWPANLERLLHQLHPAEKRPLDLGMIDDYNSICQLVESAVQKRMQDIGKG